MRGICTIAILGLALHETAYADTPTRIGAFTSICDEEVSVGLEWKSGKWERTNYKSQRLIARKVLDFKNGKQPDGSSNWCLGPGAKTQLELDTIASYSGCYGIAQQGTPPIFEWCTEYYSKDARGWNLTYIGCSGTFNPSMRFKPNGAFTLRTELGDIDPNPKDDYKDSFAVSAGSCSVIQ